MSAALAKTKAKSDFHAEPWIDDIYKFSKAERVQAAEDLLSTLATDKTALPLVKSFADSKEFEKLQFTPYIYYVPFNQTLEDRVLHLKFKTPTVAQKHKKLPLILGATYEITTGGSVVPIDYVDTFPPEIKQILSYAESVSKMSKSDKQKLYDLTIDGIKSYRTRGTNSTNQKEWLSDYLNSNRDFSFLGFALNHSYINVDPKFGDTKPLWVHGWGTPMLLFKHKTLPFILVVGPSLRLDENVIGEKNMVGFTG